MTKEEMQADKNNIVSFLKNDKELFRIYSPSYSIPQEIAGLYDLQLAEGIDPVQIKTYSDYMERASGIPENGYSVTVPPFETGNPDVDNQNYIPDAKLLGYLNVKYVISSFPIQVTGLNFVKLIDKEYVYINTYYLPRAWVEQLDPTNGINRIEAELQNYSPNSITVKTNGPGRVVFSEITYPGWIVKVDGQPSALEISEGILRSVKIPDGAHVIQMDFIPIDLFIGLGILIFTLIIILYVKVRLVVGGKQKE